MIGNVTKIDLSTYEFAPPFVATVTSINDEYLVTLTFSPDETHAVRVSFRLPEEKMEQFVKDIDRDRWSLTSMLARAIPQEVN